jgi:hypothetical protein
MEREIQMDLNNTSISRFKTNRSTSSRSNPDAKSIADSAKLLKPSSVSSSQGQQAPDLREGQIIKGQIIDHRYQEVTVMLEPGKQVIKARLEGDVSLSIGQDARFQVSEEGDRLVLKYLPNSNEAPTDTTVQKALLASNLPLTERNKAIVSELLNHKLPIDKQTLQMLVKLSHINREASPLTLVLMYKNNIPMTASNIRQFEAYQKGAGQLLNDIRTISKNLTGLLRQAINLQNVSTIVKQGDSLDSSTGPLSNDHKIESDNSVMLQEAQHKNMVPTDFQGEFKEALQMNGKLIDILYPDTNAAVAGSPADFISHILNRDELQLLGTVIGNKLSDHQSLSQTISPEITQKLVDGTLSLEETFGLLDTLYSEDFEQTSLSAFYAELTEISDGKNAALILTKLNDAYAGLQDSSIRLLDVLNPSEQIAFSQAIADFPDSGSIITRMENNSLSLNEVLQYLQTNLTKARETAAYKLLMAPEYSKLIEEAFHQKWTITPEKLSKKSSVTDLYQTLQQDLEKISVLAKSNEDIAETSMLRDPMKNLQDNLNFMKDLNEVFTYLQLPVQLKDHDLHSDLYVFTRKKSLQDRQDSISVLLHLDMKHLGQLNIHIQMDNRTIHAKFYLEDRISKQLIENNLPLLEEALKKKGYVLRSEIEDSYKKPDFSRDFIEQISPDNIIQRYSFDIRT